jgi:hypothetical protein
MAMKSALGMMENGGGYMVFLERVHHVILLIIIHKYPRHCTNYQQYINI